MIYYRCKCGDSTSWSSMGSPHCRRCSKCGSDIAMSPEMHRDPPPHELYRSTVDTDEGPVPGVSYCYFCNDTKAEIEARGEPFIAALIYMTDRREQRRIPRCLDRRRWLRGLDQRCF